MMVRREVRHELLRHGITLAIVSAFSTSIASVFLARVARLLDPILVSGLLGLLAGVFMLLLMIARRTRFDVPRLKANSGDLSRQILMRTIIGHTLLVFGFGMTDAIKGVFFSKLEPFLVVFWGRALGLEKIYFRQIALLAVHLSGAFLLSTGGQIGVFTGAQLGDGLIMLAMVFLSYTYFTGARLTRNVGVSATTAVTSLGGAAILLLLTALLIGFGVTAPQRPLDSRGLLYLAATAGFYFSGLTLWYGALKSVKSWIVSSLRALGPLAGATLAWLGFGETLTPVQIVGAAIILITSAVIASEHRHKYGR